MGHDHHHHGHHHHGSVENIKIALILNASFAVIEIVGAFLTNSVAILADAVHDLGDSMALGLAYAFEKKAKRRPDARMSYGYRRFSLLSAMLTSLFLIAGSVYVLTETIPKLFDPEMPHATGMIGLALLGVAVNGYAAMRTHGGETLNEKVVTWHLMEDLLGWVAVLICGIVLQFVEWPILDPLLSLGLTLFILRGVYKSLRSTMHVFLQGVPENIDISEVEAKIKSLDNVVDTHDGHMWSLDGEAHVFTLHVVVEEGTRLERCEQLKSEIRTLLQGIGKIHLTVEFEIRGAHRAEDHSAG